MARSDCIHVGLPSLAGMDGVAIRSRRAGEHHTNIAPLLGEGGRRSNRMGPSVLLDLPCLSLIHISK